MYAGFSGDVGCAVSTVIAILGALGKECSEVRPKPGAILLGTNSSGAPVQQAEVRLKPIFQPAGARRTC
jgi:hypothetical protein